MKSDRTKRKKNKLRGNRTFGNGDTKNRRGSGVRGGKGRAGSKKHKFSKYYMFAGTLRKLKAKPKGIAVNLEYFEEKMDRLLAKKLVEEQGGFLVVDGKKLGIAKILGKGHAGKKMHLKNLAVSEKAKEKIQAAGGKIEGLEEITEVKE